jgi:hypothetical protein
MKKPMELIDETIRTAKQPFQQTDARPQKCQKHRYERRKVREYIRLTDWRDEAENDDILNTVQTLGMRLA